MGQDLSGGRYGHCGVEGYDLRTGGCGREQFRVANCDNTVEAGGISFGPLG